MIINVARPEIVLLRGQTGVWCLPGFTGNREPLGPYSSWPRV